jgi:hypothetical protein
VASPFIAAGEGADVTDPAFRWVAVLFKADGSRNCSASLIAPRILLTAAHCEVRPGDVAVVGLLALPGAGKLAEVPAANRFKVVAERTLLESHEESAARDTVILLLDRAVPASVATPAQVGFRDAGSLQEPLKSFGWGATAKGVSSNRLREGNPVRPVSNCRDVIPDNRKVDGYVACTGSSALCPGDSGGPLVTVADPGRVLGVHARGFSSYFGFNGCDVPALLGSDLLGRYAQPLQFALGQRPGPDPGSGVVLSGAPQGNYRGGSPSGSSLKEVDMPGWAYDRASLWTVDVRVAFRANASSSFAAFGPAQQAAGAPYAGQEEPGDFVSDRPNLVPVYGKFREISSYLSVPVPVPVAFTNKPFEACYQTRTPLAATWTTHPSSCRQILPYAGTEPRKSVNFTVTFAAGTLQVTGYAVHPSSLQPLDVRLTVDGAPAQAHIASALDVHLATFPSSSFGYGTYFGFKFRPVLLAKTLTNVCVEYLDRVSGGVVAWKQLSCSPVTVAAVNETCPTPMPASKRPDLFDVKPTDSFANPIYCMIERGVIEPKKATLPDWPSSVSPRSNVTRAEAAVMLWRMAGSPRAWWQSIPLPWNSLRDCGFADWSRVPSWARDAVCWLKQQGVPVNDSVTGNDKGVFNGSAAMTRGESARWLWRFTGELAPVPGPSTCRFSDYASLPLDSRVEACALLNAGVTTSTRFDAARAVTRAEFATLQWRLGVYRGLWKAL